MKTLTSIMAGLLLAINVSAQTNTPPTPPAVTTNTVPSLPEHVNTWLTFLSTTRKSGTLTLAANGREGPYDDWSNSELIAGGSSHPVSEGGTT